MVLPTFWPTRAAWTVSYFEWVQDFTGELREEAEIQTNASSGRWFRAFRETHEQAKSREVSMRKGAYCVAVARVAEATKLRGLYP